MPKLEIQQKKISILVHFFKICQFLAIIVLRSVRVLFYETVSSKRSVLDVLILFSNWFLGIVIAQLICVLSSVLLQPLLVNVLSNRLHLQLLIVYSCSEDRLYCRKFC